MKKDLSACWMEHCELNILDLEYWLLRTDKDQIHEIVALERKACLDKEEDFSLINDTVLIYMPGSKKRLILECLYVDIPWGSTYFHKHCPFLKHILILSWVQWLLLLCLWTFCLDSQGPLVHAYVAYWWLLLTVLIAFMLVNLCNLLRC